MGLALVVRWTVLNLMVFLKKCANPGLFFNSFWPFQTNNTIFTTNQREKMSCPSSILCQDSNPRPLKMSRLT